METKNKCNHFTELGEELIFIDKEEAHIKCLFCNEVFIYKR